MVGAGHQLWRFLARVASSWGEHFLHRAEEVWGEALQESPFWDLEPSEVNRLAAYRPIEERRANLDAKLYFLCATFNEPRGAPLLPCEVCGCWTGAWCDGCEQNHHLVCTQCSQDGFKCCLTSDPFPIFY